MTFRDLVSSACSSLLQRKIRSALTVGGVALGAMLLFSSLSGGLGVLDVLQNRLEVGDRLRRIEVRSGMKSPPKGELHSIEKSIPDSVTGSRRKRMADVLARRAARKQPVPLTLNRLSSIAEIKGVAEAYANLSWNSELKLPGKSISQTRVQTISAKNQSVADLVVMGRPLSKNSAPEVLVSETWLYDRGFQSDEVLSGLIGTEVTLADSNSRGRMSPERLAQAKQSIRMRERLLVTPAFTLSNDQRGLIEGELRQLRSRVEAHEKAAGPALRSPVLRIVGIYKTPPDGFQSDAGLIKAFYNHVLIPAGIAVDYRSAIYQPKRGAAKPVNGTVICDSSETVRNVVRQLKGQGLQCTSFADLAFRIRTSVLIVTAIVTIVAGVAFLIAALGMTNTMVMNVLERRREIGILKSIGARDKDIMGIFLAEGLMVGVIGGALGLTAGLLLTASSETFIRDFLERRLSEPITAPLFSRPVWLLLGTPVVAGVVSTLASVLPARQASRLNPVHALREL